MAAEHATKIYTVALVGIVVIVAFLALTSVGHVIDAATQHFMLFYAGVFALIGLCASVGLGLVSTDRMLLQPGHRVFVQAAHRAASFGAVAFLIIHVVTEILAQRVHVLDAVVPFLSPFRTFYIGLGTLSSDLLILLAITGIMRGRFNATGKAWRWRAIHYTSYAAFVFGVWHGLLAGRPGKPYVDWSYGFVVAFVLLGLAIRVLSNSLRPKENLSAPPVDQSAGSASAPLRAAAMLAQYGATRGGRSAVLGASTGAQPMLSAPVTATVVTTLTDDEDMTPQPQPYYEPGYEGPPRYLGAPRAEETGPVARATGSIPRAVTGAEPRATGPLPYATGPLPRVTGSMPRADDGWGTGPLRPSLSGPMSRPDSGPMPRPATGRPATGAMPRAATGSFPAAPARPQSWPETGPLPRVTGSMPLTGSMPRADDGWGTGPRPRPVPGPVPPGPDPRRATGSWPRGGTGSMPAGSAQYSLPAGSGPYPAQTGSGPYPAQTDSGPYPLPTGSGAYPTRAGSGPYPAQTDSGPYPAQTGSGPYPLPTGSGAYPTPTGSGAYPTRAGSGPYPAPAGSGAYPLPTGSGAYPTRAGSGSYPTRAGSGAYPAPTGSGAYPRPSTGPVPTGSGAYPRPPTGPMPQPGRPMPPPPYPGGGTGRQGGREWMETSHDGGWHEQPPWVDEFADTDPDLRYREPGPGMPGYRGAREQRYGGDRY